MNVHMNIAFRLLLSPWSNYTKRQLLIIKILDKKINGILVLAYLQSHAQSYN